MAVSKPASVPNWADSVTGLTRRTDPGSLADDGVEPGDRFTAQHANYQFGLLGDWAAFLNNPDTLQAGTLAGTTGVLGGYVATGGPETQHATATHVYGPSSFGIASTWVIDNASNTLLLAASSGTGEAQLHIPQVRGSRVRVVRVYCRALGAAAADITLAMRKVTAAAGSASPTVATLTDTTTSGTTVNSTTTANIQVIAFSLTAAELAANEHLVVRVHGANTTGDKAIYRVEVDVDRVSNAT